MALIALSRHFYILTDHKPLTYALASKPERYSPRQSRHLDFISQFTSDIRHIRGSDNTVADALSRFPISAVHLSDSLPAMDFQAMAVAQAEDTDIQSLCDDSSLKLQRVPLTLSDGVTLLCDVSTGVQRPVVPTDFRRPVFDVLHSLSHPGIRATQRLVTQHFVWPGVNKDVRRWARACLQCQRAKVHQHTRTAPGTFTTPDVRFEHVHVDLVGPLPPCHGYVYLLTCVDRFTRWPEVVPIPDGTAATVAQAFVTTWVARFGTPAIVTTDRGGQFESHLWQAFTRLLGTKHIRTTAYHPCANGLVERLHRQLKGAIKGHPHQEHWVDVLPLVLLGIRTSLKEDLGCTMSELVYGTTLRLPGSFFSSPAGDSTSDPSSYVVSLRNRMQALKAVPPRTPSQTHAATSDRLSQSNYVFVRHDAVRKPLQPPYDGPFKVLERCAKYFTLDINGRHDTVSIDRLKPAHLDSTCNPTDAVPDSAVPPPSISTPPSPIPVAEPWSSMPSTTRTTRSGRRVHWPAHLADYFAP